MLMRKYVTCLVMAGGKGTRYGSPSKIVADVCGKVLIRRVIDSVRHLCKIVIIALSKYTINLAAVAELCREGVSCLETSGEDYVKDLVLLTYSLPKPLLVISGDVVTRKSVIEDFLTKALEMDEEVITMTVVKSYEEPVGVSLFKGYGGSWANITYNSKDVVDIDTKNDLEISKELCRDS